MRVIESTVIVACRSHFACAICLIKAVVVLGTAIFVVACTSLGTLSPEQSVKIRAQARWDAVISGNWEVAYGFTSPGYRESVDLFGYRSRLSGLIKFKSAEVVSVVCQEVDSCKAKVRVTFATLDGGFGDATTFVEERWLLDKGEWWQFLEA